ncbi:MAG: iron-containing alcohol dehydrogenase, partial [Desulfobacteraceae bacterium]|nr:iron-containing alcohol dehydrogenase [Desulfobacteraceae bacterium]
MIKSFQSMRRIVFGVGSLEGLGEEIRRLGGTKVLVVTDPGLKKAGVVDQVTAVLEKEKFGFSVFADVEPDPKVDVALASAAAAKAWGPDVIVGLGGGSSLD